MGRMGLIQPGILILPGIRTHMGTMPFLYANGLRESFQAVARARGPHGAGCDNGADSSAA